MNKYIITYTYIYLFFFIVSFYSNNITFCKNNTYNIFLSKNAILEVKLKKTNKVFIYNNIFKYKKYSLMNMYNIISLDFLIKKNIQLYYIYYYYYLEYFMLSLDIKNAYVLNDVNKELVYLSKLYFIYQKYNKSSLPDVIAKINYNIYNILGMNQISLSYKNISQLY